jgi:tRNA G10  N-methylase Trm11
VGQLVSITNNPNQYFHLSQTPLEPVAAFSLCNIAGIRDGQRILDPYSGSCAILLAAAMIAKDLQQVGIDSAHDGFINRDHIREDFETRGLQQPKAVFRGDSRIEAIRDRARAAVGDEPFDHIITDPPYGVREALEAGAPSSLEEMFQAIKEDRERGKPLLRKGGKLVCFVPLRPEQNLVDELPSQEQADEAGMKFLLSREQPLNSKLSRWLVSYECIR